MNDRFEFEGYEMRLIQPQDISAYYDFGFNTVSEQTKYLTGTTEEFTKEQVASYIHRISEDATRYDFLISKGEHIIGEAVLSDISEKNAHFRIAIFSRHNFSKGIGFSATNILLDFAFGNLGLESVELEVYPFNERGVALYTKVGFKLVDRIMDEEAKDPYKELCLMRLNKEDYIKS